MTTVLTNGCFDVLHDGHLALLRYCKSLGDDCRVVVAINSDESVHRLKGFYPANKCQARMSALQATGLVDTVEIFDSESKLVELVINLQPNFMVKGSDYEGKKITGQSELEALGGSVRFFELVPGLSSTALIAEAGITRTRVKKVEKGWGYELWVTNIGEYCSKMLVFTEAGKGTSMHFHAIKDESWYVASGRFGLVYIDVSNGSTKDMFLVPGDVVRVKPNNPHRINCIEPGSIFEASTQHFDSDSYRVAPGSSQKN